MAAILLGLNFAMSPLSGEATLGVAVVDVVTALLYFAAYVN
jgi:hypothetical protein